MAGGGLGLRVSSPNPYLTPIMKELPGVLVPGVSGGHVIDAPAAIFQESSRLDVPSSLT
jgi:hypothetical protein